MRKSYLDVIRWSVICLVVVFHVFFYFNTVGVTPIFKYAEPYSGSGFSFAGVFQYVVYPWFMLLLFIVAGISAFHSLQKRTAKQFIKERVVKLIVPSTLGVLLIGWVSGSIIFSQAAEPLPPEMPALGKYLIYSFSGIGALWFCQELFVASLVLLLVRCIDKTDALRRAALRVFGSKAGIILLLLLFFPVWGSSKILNAPLITAYRSGIYIFAFLLGYYVFSLDEVQKKLEKWCVPLAVCAVPCGVYYVLRAYGTYYASAAVLETWYTNLYVWVISLALLGLAGRWNVAPNAFSTYMKKSSFGLYVLHIPVLLISGYFLIQTELPLWAIYTLQAVFGFGVSLLLWEVLRRIPVLRFLILGIQKPKKA